MNTLSVATQQTSPAPNVSFEFFPPKTDKMEARLWESVQRLSPMAPKFVSVTYGAGGSTRDRTQKTVAKIAQDTPLSPAAHLTCVGATKEEVLQVATDFWNAGVRHLVALRGDPPEGMGAKFEQHPDGFRDSVDLIQGIRDYDIAPGARFEISVSCYPERPISVVPPVTAPTKSPSWTCPKSCFMPELRRHYANKGHINRSFTKSSPLIVALHSPPRCQSSFCRATR